jgi:hypothetical protein
VSSARKTVSKNVTTSFENELTTVVRKEPEAVVVPTDDGGRFENFENRLPAGPVMR